MSLHFLFGHNYKEETLSPPKIAGVIQAPILAPLEKALIYDYPAYFTLRDELFTLYTFTEVEQQKPPSGEAKKLIQKLQKTPVWMGIYDHILARFKHRPLLLWPHI